MWNNVLVPSRLLRFSRTSFGVSVFFLLSPLLRIQSKLMWTHATTPPLSSLPAHHTHHWQMWNCPKKTVKLQAQGEGRWSTTCGFPQGAEEDRVVIHNIRVSQTSGRRVASGNLSFSLSVHSTTYIRIHRMWRNLQYLSSQKWLRVQSLTMNGNQTGNAGVLAACLLNPYLALFVNTH